MTETEAPVPTVYQPGPGELSALRYMNEIEPSDARPRAHIVARETTPWMYDLFAWSAKSQLWQPWRGIVNQARQTAVRALADVCEGSDVTLLEEAFDFDAYDHPDPHTLDELIGDEGRTVLCREGAPGTVDQWSLIGFGSRGPTAIPSMDTRFFSGSLKDRFLKAARVDMPVPLGPNAIQDRKPPVMVRHGVVARELLPKDRWGVEGRPDLLARRSDRELAIRAAAEAEMERQRKAGEWLAPPAQVYGEIAIRMQKEWEAQDRTARAA